MGSEKRSRNPNRVHLQSTRHRERRPTPNWGDGQIYKVGSDFRTAGCELDSSIAQNAERLLGYLQRM